MKTLDIDRILKKHDYKKSSLIPILQDIQAEHRWLPMETLKYVSEKLNIPLIDVYSLATFYKSFSLKPRGKHVVTACCGTACHVRGGPKVLQELQNELHIDVEETTPDKNFTLETVRCLGACALGPVVVIDKKYHGHMNSKKVPSILKKYKRK
ncbi:MAG TPA: NAD(P)H-dependent oxidoreductase subunit E [Candidatus Thermoplasmatota archaeon]|nr:NAD(P)H-dependent oxidoreductase subunit E [Candidatus Thermoplasmatota archaeon]